MSQHYSDPSREDDPYTLPNIETFQAAYSNCPFCTKTNVADYSFGDFRCEYCSKGRKGYTVPQDEIGQGWYWWTCFPGCLPDGDPMGPFDTEEDAIADAQENAE